MHLQVARHLTKVVRAEADGEDLSESVAYLGKAGEEDGESQLARLFRIAARGQVRKNAMKRSIFNDQYLVD